MEPPRNNYKRRQQIQDGCRKMPTCLLGRHIVRHLGSILFVMPSAKRVQQTVQLQETFTDWRILESLPKHKTSTELTVGFTNSN